MRTGHKDRQPRKRPYTCKPGERHNGTAPISRGRNFHCCSLDCTDMQQSRMGRSLRRPNPDREVLVDTENLKTFSQISNTIGKISAGLTR